MTMKKGFRLPARTALLDFSGTEYDGAVVRVRLNVPLRLLLELQAIEQGDSGEVKEGFLKFAREALVDWNLEGEDGQPIPATAEGILNVSTAFATYLISQWSQVVARPPAPLAGPSANGSTSAEQSAPTAESSLSLGDLSRPS
jgi:hypothetical protein